MFHKASRVFSSSTLSLLGARGISSKSIGTHNGFFHCDEALAVYLLRQTKEFKDAQLIRTRDPSVLSKCDVVVDVGGEFDATRLRFDHHQKSFSENFDSLNNIKLSSAGLIYKYFGREVISNFLVHESDKVEPSTLELIYKRVYNNFIKSVDGVDNGIPCSLGATLYKDNTGISSRIRRLNIQWNEKKTETIENERFEKASALVGNEFEQSLREVVFNWLPAKQIVKKSFEERFKRHSSGKVIVLDTVCPWHEHLNALDTDSVFYTIFPVSNNDWRVQCVKKENSAFESKRPLPLQWRGLSQCDLRKITSLPTATFVHASGFIGGCGSYEDAMKMADMTLNIDGFA